MLAYPSFMQRHPHFAAAAVGSSYPQALPAFPQFSSAAVTSPPMPVAAFALQAQIPSPVLSPPAAARTVTQATVKQESADRDSSSSKKNEQQQPKSSFSIESILARDSDKAKNKSADHSAARRDHHHQQAQAASPPQTVPTCTTSSLSPATPLSAGPKPSATHNGFYYFYPPATQAAFPFTTPQSCLESELHRMHGRLSAPVAVISEIVRNAAGMLCILSI